MLRRKIRRVMVFGMILLFSPSISMAQAGTEVFREGWERAPLGAYIPSADVSTPADLPLIPADEGDWFVGDTVSEFPECGPTPHRAEIITQNGGRALRLTSNDSNSECSDNVWVILTEVPAIRLNAGFSVPLTSDTFISFEETGTLADPAVGSPTELVLPGGDTVSLLMTDGRGNVLAYIFQRAPARQPNTLHANYREILLDPNGSTYTRNLFADFSTVPAFDPAASGGHQIRSIEFKVQEHGFAILDDLVISEKPMTPAVLENPQPAAFQSGIGVISGWVCEATRVDVEFNGGARFEAAYGTSRTDTTSVCGDANNGFSLLFNWNLLGDGIHTVRALADGVEFAAVTITVTTLGAEFLTGISGEFTVTDFPNTGTEVTIQWQQSQQNFVIISGSASGGGSSGSGGRVLENPQPGSFQSGIGVISGFVCQATLVEIEFDGTATFDAAYGTSRGDTASVCGDTNNGFSLLFNWNLLGDGPHTVRALADGVEFANVTVTVTTFGVEFLTGVNGEFTLLDFPEGGTDIVVQWQQSQQNFVIVDVFTPQPALSVSLGALDFGENTVGNSSEHSFEVTNSGGGMLTGTVTTAAPFSLLSGAAFSLNAGESQTVTVMFSPTSLGTFTGSASMMSNGGTATVSLSGIGLSGGGGDPNCEVVFSGPSFLQVINALGTSTGGLDVEIAFLEALVRPGACELYGLPAGTYTADMTQCEFSAADVAIGDFSDCTEVGATRSVTFTVSSGDTHTIEVTPSFFSNSVPNPNCMEGFFKQPSYSGNCSQRPSGTVCMAFTDDYIWLIEDIVKTIEIEAGNCNGYEIRKRIGDKSEYYHILFTEYIKEIAIPQ